MDLEQELNNREITISVYSGTIAYNYNIDIFYNAKGTNTTFTIYSTNINKLVGELTIALINDVESYFLDKYNNSIISNFNSNVKSKLTVFLTKPKKTRTVPRYSYFPKDNDELYYLVKKLIKIRGYNCSLNDIDTSRITNMDGIFNYSYFRGDISKWNVNKVSNMKYMFIGSILEGNEPTWWSNSYT